MPPMTITETVTPVDRAQWRAWLAERHATKQEIWLLLFKRSSGKTGIGYREAVEEALCFGWIDGIAKTYDHERNAQRFTPRRPKSHWTELNKDRARRLIAAGLMTPAGFATLPDLDESTFRIPDDIAAALQADPDVWQNFQQFPASYVRIRVSYIDEARAQPTVFTSRLANFIAKTRKGVQYGVLE
ncbi:MAG: YdeI/OmpD-associated family protein [Dehalococcoidia bacterium]|nr:YdeI/OmpD-associated family protein [Dehalococcoidia bacterium]